MKRKKPPVNPNAKGDDIMYSGSDSSMFNVQQSDDDYEEERRERIEAERLKPHLNLLNTIVTDEIYDMNNLTNMVDSSDKYDKTNAMEVLVELRARKLHIEWLKNFEAKIKNIQNTLDELND